MVLAHLEHPSKRWALTVTLVKEKEKGRNMMSNWTPDTGQNFRNHQLQKGVPDSKCLVPLLAVFPDLAYRPKSWSQSSPDYQTKPPVLTSNHLKFPWAPWPGKPWEPKGNSVNSGYIQIRRAILISLLAHASDKAFFSIHIGQSADRTNNVQQNSLGQNMYAYPKTVTAPKITTPSFP
jgi:hypothetical protein